MIGDTRSTIEEFLGDRYFGRPNIPRDEVEAKVYWDNRADEVFAAEAAFKASPAGQKARERLEAVQEDNRQRQANIDARHANGEWLIGIDGPLDGQSGCRSCCFKDLPGCALCR